jgi:hypothetical protein
MTDASYQAWMVTFERAQLLPCAGRTVIFRQGEQPVVRLEFAIPSPMSLLSQA